MFRKLKVLLSQMIQRIKVAFWAILRKEVKVVIEKSSLYAMEELKCTKKELMKMLDEVEIEQDK